MKLTTWNIRGLGSKRKQRNLSNRMKEEKRQNELVIECGKLMINSSKMKDLTSYSFTNIS